MPLVERRPPRRRLLLAGGREKSNETTYDYLLAEAQQSTLEASSAEHPDLIERFLVRPCETEEEASLHVSSSTSLVLKTRLGGGDNPTSRECCMRIREGSSVLRARTGRDGTRAKKEKKRMKRTANEKRV
jgi:hypothetical protein